MKFPINAVVTSLGWVLYVAGENKEEDGWEGIYGVYT